MACSNSLAIRESMEEVSKKIYVGVRDVQDDSEEGGSVS
jgi:hypothetical protein